MRRHLRAAGEKSFDQFPCFFVLKILSNPQLRPAFRGRQLTGTAEQELVFGDAGDVVVFQQLAEMSDQEKTVRTVNLFHRPSRRPPRRNSAPLRQAIDAVAMYYSRQGASRFAAIYAVGVTLSTKHPQAVAGQCRYCGMELEEKS
jgi:hypothetical protein